MPFLFIWLLLAAIYVLAYYLGPSESRIRGFTTREKSALSIACGFGIALPIIATEYTLELLPFLGSAVAGLFAAAVAGRRPILHAGILNVVTLFCWLMQKLIIGGGEASTPDGPLHLWGVLLLLNAIHPTLLPLYLVWQKRRGNDSAKNRGAQLPGPIVTTAANAPASVPHPATTMAQQGELQQIVNASERLRHSPLDR